MKKINNDNGIALVTALMFTLISLGVIMMLLAIVSQGTRVSGASKRYKNAVEAGYGGLDVLTRDILPTKFSGSLDATYKTNLANAIALAFPQEACFTEKLEKSTASWSSACSNSSTLLATQSPDMTFTLKASNDTTGFKVYAKIVDSRCGGDAALGQPCTNSDTSGIDYLDAGGGVTSATGMVTPQHRPAYFRIEIQSERAANPIEKGQLSILYGY